MPKFKKANYATLFYSGLFILLSTICSGQNFVTIETKSGEEISITELSEKLVKLDVVFFGETHDDSLTHVLQYMLFQQINDQSNKLALSMEMFETDVQIIVDEYAKGLISEKKFLSDSRPWSNYEDYRPMVELAKDNNLKIIAANAPRRYVSLVSTNGQNALRKLSKQAKRFIPKIPVDTLSGKYHQKFVAEMGGEAHFKYNNIYHAQNLWDATMAHSIRKFKKKNKNHLIYHLCGSFHSDEHLGTIAHLKLKNKNLKISNITVIEIEEGKTQKDYYHLADFVIFKK